MTAIIKDIKHEIQSMDRNAKSIRKFGFILAVLLLGLSSFFLVKESPWWMEVGISGIVISLLVYVYPQAIKPLYLLLTVFSIVVGYFMSKIVLSLMFFLFFAPVGVFTRLIRKDLLNRRFQKEGPTYWIKRDSKKPAKDQYERLF